MIGKMPLKEIQLKDLKDILRTKGVPISQIIWEDTHDFKPYTWKSLWKVQVPVKWNETGEKAFRKGWMKIPRLCSLCGVEESTIHLFWDCAHVGNQ